MDIIFSACYWTASYRATAWVQIFLQLLFLFLSNLGVAPESCGNCVSLDCSCIIGHLCSTLYVVTISSLLCVNLSLGLEGCVLPCLRSLYISTQSGMLVFELDTVQWNYRSCMCVVLHSRYPGTSWFIYLRRNSMPACKRHKSGSFSRYSSPQLTLVWPVSNQLEQNQHQIQHLSFFFRWL